MTVIHRVSRLTVGVGALSLMAAGAQGQLYTNSNLAASDFTFSTFSDTSGTFDTDVRGAVDYSNIDIFGDGFIVASLPEAPNSGGGDTATTGLFLSANNTGANPNTAGVAAFINGLSVGNGTANEDYVLRFDVFHSTGTGLVDTNDTPETTDDTFFSLGGTTNYQFAGLNYSAPVIQIGASTDGGATGGNGIGLLVTADSGAAEDFATVYNNIGHGSRIRSDQFDFVFSKEDLPGPPVVEGADVRTFLAQEAIALANGEPIFDDPTNGARFTGDNGAAYWQANFPRISGDPAYTVNPAFLIDDADGSVLRVAPNDGTALFDDGEGGLVEEFILTNQPEQGVPYNRWATHEIYWVDDVWTYAIDGVPIAQIDTIAEAAEFDALSTAGEAFIGFYDRFSSVAGSPDGANFVVYDNIVVDSAIAGDVPDFAAAIAPFIDTGVIVGDYNSDGFVSQPDLDLVLLNWGDGTLPAGFDEAALDGGGPFDSLISQNELDGVLLNWGQGTPPAPVNAIPEPASLALLGLGGLALTSRRRRA